MRNLDDLGFLFGEDCVYARFPGNSRQEWDGRLSVEASNANTESFTLQIYIYAQNDLVNSIPSRSEAFFLGSFGSFFSFVLYSLNIYWFSLIMKGVIKLLKAQKKQPTEEKSQ